MFMTLVRRKTLKTNRSSGISDETKAEIWKDEGYTEGQAERLQGIKIKLYQQTGQNFKSGEQRKRDQLVVLVGENATNSLAKDSHWTQRGYITMLS